MTYHQHEREPDEVPSEESLDVEGPNESTEPTGAPGLDEQEGNSAGEDDNG